MNYNKTRIIAAIGTIAAHVLILVLSVCFVITHTPRQSQHEEWPPKDSSEILFGGEYVMLGDVIQESADETRQETATQPEDVAETDATEADDLSDAGTQGSPTKVVTSSQESDMKVEQKPVEKPGPSKDELEAQEKARAEKEKSAQITSQMQNAFAKNGKTSNGGGKQGSKDGNTDNGGAVNGSPGHDLAGRTVPYWGRPSSKKSGIIRISVKVNPQGRVTSAVYKSGEGAAASDETIRQSCINAAKQSRFSVSTKETKEQSGTITWRFR